jgi:hypothetical protein
VLDPFFEQMDDMLVIQSVIQRTVLAAHFDEMKITKGAQMVADRGLTHREQLGDFADRELALSESPHDLNPGIISESFEGLRKKAEKPCGIFLSGELVGDSIECGRPTHI